MPKLSRIIDKVDRGRHKPLHRDAKVGKKHPKPGSFSYPWHEWFKMESFTLRRGKDYGCRTYIMAQQLRNKASEAGLSVTISVSPDEASITCYVGGKATSERAETYKK